MLARWTRRLLWRPFELACRRVPLWPFQASVEAPVEGVQLIRIHNALVRALGRFAGGYDYAVCYLIDGQLLVDTGFPWARRCLAKTLRALGALETLTDVVNTHEHEDHTGNNDLVEELTRARLWAHPLAVADIRLPPALPWYRHFLFGPGPGSRVEAAPAVLRTRRFTLEAMPMPGHCPGHLCLFEPSRRWLFAGDLYVAADLDAQLADVDGPRWIASLESALALRPAALFDGHGVVLLGEDAVRAALDRKRELLLRIWRETLRHAPACRSLAQLTAAVFARGGLVGALSQNEGWMSIITASDFSRSNLVRTFARNPVLPDSSATQT